VCAEARSSYESRQVPDVDEVLGYLEAGRNWGRWGEDDQVGAPNLITEEKVRQATALVSQGRTISLSRTLAIPSEDPPGSSPSYVMKHIEGRSGGGGSDDVLTLGCHGLSVTHLERWGTSGMDAACGADGCLPKRSPVEGCAGEGSNIGVTGW
jgi:hypothetical protein